LENSSVTVEKGVDSSVTVEKVLIWINELKAFPLPFTVKTEVDRSTKFPQKCDVFFSVPVRLANAHRILTAFQFALNNMSCMKHAIPPDVTQNWFNYAFQANRLSCIICRIM